MDALGFFALRRGDLPGRGAALLDAPDEVLRARPHGLNSVAWLVWHVARCEDVGVNRLLVDGRQVFDEGTWAARLRVPRRDIGTGMTAAEVDELSARVDLPALRGYWAAVTDRTAAVAAGLRAEALDAPVDAAHLGRICAAEGILGPNAGWVQGMWATRPNRGWFLAQLALTHTWGHLYDAAAVRGLLPGAPPAR